MRNYQCKKCRTLIEANSRPSSLNCPAGSLHEWQDLGETGQYNYQCKKCAAVVKSKNTPSSLGCPAGSLHQWTKLS